jgi:hypothetical protein
MSAGSNRESLASLIAVQKAMRNADVLSHLSRYTMDPIYGESTRKGGSHSVGFPSQ